MLKIPLNKGDKCPICDKLIIKPNTWVKYHISYNPEMVILACKYCNYTEYCLRTGQKGGRSLSKLRVARVIQLQGRFNKEI